MIINDLNSRVNDLRSKLNACESRVVECPPCPEVEETVIVAEPGSLQSDINEYGAFYYR